MNSPESTGQEISRMHLQVLISTDIKSTEPEFSQRMEEQVGKADAVFLVTRTDRPGGGFDVEILTRNLSADQQRELLLSALHGVNYPRTGSN